MLINRNNYEDFFLLYADDELSAYEREAVEKFVTVNEDLRVELEMIQAAILTPDEITLTDKSFLYKETIFNTEFQEKLLLKLDDELSINESADIDSLLQKNRKVQTEYNQLLKAKLDACEKIIFQEKHLLYKKEKDNVVIFGYLRWAAAAIIIGIALFTGIKLYNNKNDRESELVINPIKSIKPTKNINEDEKKMLVENVIEKTVAVRNNIKTKSTNNKLIIDDKIKNNSKNIVTNTKDKRIINNNSINELKELKNNNNQFIAKEDRIKLLEKLVPKELTKENVVIAKNNLKVVSKIEENIKPLEDTYKDAVAVNNISEEDKNENKILYMSEENVKKSKVGGFFRKIKRFVERTANVKTGNTLQIAGFEIAAK